MKRKVVHDYLNRQFVNKTVFICLTLVANCCQTAAFRFESQFSDKNAVVRFGQFGQPYDNYDQFDGERWPRNNLSDGFNHVLNRNTREIANPKPPKFSSRYRLKNSRKDADPKNENTSSTNDENTRKELESFVENLNENIDNLNLFNNITSSKIINSLMNTTTTDQINGLNLQDKSFWSSLMRFPTKLYRCMQSLNLRRCIRIMMSRRMLLAAEYIKETNATVKSLADILNLPTNDFPDDFDFNTNATDQELDKIVLETIEEIARYKNVPLDMGAGLVLEPSSDKTLNFRFDMDGLAEARKKSKKGGYLKFLLIPAFVVAGMIPFVLPGLKMAVLIVVMVNNFLFWTALISLIRGIIFEKPPEKIVYVNAGYDHHEPHHDHYKEIHDNSHPPLQPPPDLHEHHDSEGGQGLDGHASASESLAHFRTRPLSKKKIVRIHQWAEDRKFETREMKGSR